MDRAARAPRRGVPSINPGLLRLTVRGPGEATPRATPPVLYITEVGILTAGTTDNLLAVDGINSD